MNYFHHGATLRDQGEQWRRWRKEVFSKIQQKEEEQQKLCNKAFQARCTRATQGNGIFYGQEWARFVTKDMEKSQLYTSTTSKNGAHLWKSLKQDKLAIE